MRPLLSFADVEFIHQTKERFLFMNNKAELVFILDRSGSMSGLESDTIGGFNSMIEKQKKNEGECYVSTILFDHESKVLHDRIKLADVPKMTDEDYVTRGSTALLDAIGGAILHIAGIHKYARPEDVPAHTLFVITTDGMENASHIYDADKVKTMIERQKKNYGWEFIFLGANIDAVNTASRIGIGAERAANFHNDTHGVKLNYRAMGEAICAVRACKTLSDDWKEKIDTDFKKRSI